MENLNDLYYFAQTVEHGGFAPAGRAIGVPKSKLSRRVAALEERLGVRLIHRSTRHFSTTDTGQTYYEHCKAMLVEAEAAQEAIDSVRAAPRGVIRLACPVTLLHVHVGPFLAGFMRDYPGITVHLEATNRRVDLVHEAVDVAIRVRQPPLEDSDLVMKVLSERHLGLLASPDLIERHGSPAEPDALGDWPSLWLGGPLRDHRYGGPAPGGAGRRGRGATAVADRPWRFGARRTGPPVAGLGSAPGHYSRRISVPPWHAASGPRPDRQPGGLLRLLR